MAELMDVAEQAVREAGKLIQKHFRTDIAAQCKEDRTFVTKLDIEAERMIVDHVRSSFPDHGILAEEGSMGAAGNPEYVWVIDPLDGTYNFIRGMEAFGVQIAVLYRNEFIAGVVYLPSNDTLYNAEKGQGAFKNGNRISVSSTAPLSKCTVTFDSSMRSAGPHTLKVLEGVGHTSYNMRMFGAAARNLTCLCEGTTDAAIEFDDKPWDFAASVCILREAGGKITDFDGNDVRLEKTTYVASNGVVHDQLLSVLRSCSGKIE